MMKPFFIFTGFLILVFSGFLGCQKYPLPPETPPTPTPTPAFKELKPKPAPGLVCSNPVPVPVPDHDGPMLDPFFILRSVEDWNAYFGCSACSSTIPAPPVDFNNEMIAVFSQEYGDVCTDAVTIRRVCTASSSIEIHYDFRDRYRDPDCNFIGCVQVYIPLHVTRAIRLPASRFPVVWVRNDLCP